MRTNHSEIVVAIADGAVHRYGELIELFDSRVRLTVSQKVTDPAAIEDLVQEIFYKAFKQIGKLQDPEKFESWLFTISRRCIADHFRKLGSTQIPRTNSNLNESADLQNTVLHSRSEWLWEEVDHLQVEFSQILKLRYQLSLTYEEIAERIQTPISTVRGRIYEARKALRLRLEKKGLYP